MILAVFLVLSEIIFGYRIIFWAGVRASPIERFLYSVIVGIIVGSWLLFVLQMFLELNYVSILLSIAIMLLASYKMFEKSPFFQSLISRKIRLKFKLGKRDIKENRNVILFFGLLFVVLAFLNYTHNLEPKADGLYSGRNNWGDLAGHLNVVMPFVENANKNLEYPDYAGTRMSYRFMFEFFTSALISGGVPIREALVIPGIVLSMIIFLLFYLLARQITQNKKIAAISLILYAFAGGLGFIYFLEDLQSNKVNPSGMTDYTHYPDKKIFFSNQIATLILPQRSTLIGFPAAFIVFAILWRWFNRKAEYKEMIFAALIIGLMPFFHWHTFFAIGFISVLLFFLDLKITILTKSYKKIDKKRLKSWIIFFLIIAILSAPQISFSITPLTDKIGKGFIEPISGWLSKDQNWLVFWVFNLGVLFVLALPAFLFARRQLKIFYIPFLGLFVLSNLFKFQPWDFDNLKIFYMWLPVHSIMIAAFVHKVFEKKKSLAMLIIALSIFSGILAVISEAQTSYRLYGYTEVELGKWVRENTPKDAVFLTYTGHDQFVPGLGGRRIFMGFEGWLWSRGIFDYHQRIDAIKRMYNGGEEAVKLLEKYGIDYVVIGPTERANYKANETFFDSNFPIVKEFGGYKIYKV